MSSAERASRSESWTTTTPSPLSARSTGSAVSMGSRPSRPSSRRMTSSTSTTSTRRSPGSENSRRAPGQWATGEREPEASRASGPNYSGRRWRQAEDHDLDGFALALELQHSAFEPGVEPGRGGAGGRDEDLTGAGDRRKSCGDVDDVAHRGELRVVLLADGPHVRNTRVDADADG